MDDPTPPGGYFPLSVIRSILFGDDKLTDIPIRSKAPNDFTKVIKVPIGIGLYLASLDPGEAFFHIETFPATAHAEVWLNFEWTESSARQGRVREIMSKERAIRDKFNGRMAEMIKVMPERLSPADKNHLAATILAEMSYNRFDQVLKFLNVAELYVKYEEEDKANAEATSEAVKDDNRRTCSEEGKEEATVQEPTRVRSGDVQGLPGLEEREEDHRAESQEAGCPSPGETPSEVEGDQGPG
jgi:hypothetical protein